MVPIYATLSTYSLVYYQRYIYFELIRNCYEAFAIASFFTLLSNYIAPNLHSQKQYFRKVQPKPWKFPLNWAKIPRSGLTWFNIIYAGIFQFCFTRPLLTIIASIAQSQKIFCDKSTKPEYAHLWIAILQGICVVFVMYCLVQFYAQIKEDIVQHRPLLKILCVKLVLFLVFWQVWLLGLLSRKGGPLQPNQNIVGPDIHVGIPCILVGFEMTVLAILHHKAFPYKPYKLDSLNSDPDGLVGYSHGPTIAILDAVNPWDYIKAMARGCRWLFCGVHDRENDPSYRDECSNPIAKIRTGAYTDPGPFTGTRAYRVNRTRHTWG